MQMSKSYSDTVKEARAAAQSARNLTPAGYPVSGQRGPDVPILNLNKPGVFAAMLAHKPLPADHAGPMNTTGVPASQLSPPARAPNPYYYRGVDYSNMGPTALEYAQGRGPFGQAAPKGANALGYRNPGAYVNTNWGGMPDIYGMPQQLGSYRESELGDFLTDIVQAVGSAAQTYGQVTTAETTAAMARVGINPVGYSAAGTPIYQSTPAGVTPTYAGALPSGLVLPPGVTSSYPYPVGFVQQAGASGVYQIAPPTLPVSANVLLPVLAIGGGLLLLLAVMK